MAVFEYSGVRAANGKSVKGVQDAENAKALRLILRREGVLLTEVHEESGKVNKKSRRGADVLAPLKRAGAGDVAVMTRQLATLVRAGIPLVESISALTEQLEKEDLKRVMGIVREKLNEGTSFAKALEEHPRTFPPLYIHMIAAGEASGTLETVLERLADFTEAQAQLRGKVGAALAYPMLMGILGTVLMGVLMVFVVPKVTSIFQSMDKPLPWYTSLLIFVSSFIADYWWVVLLSVGGAVYAFRRWVKTTQGRYRWDTIRLRLPIIGNLVLLLAVARFAKTLSTLLAGGVPLLRAMDIVRNVLGNAVLEDVIKDAIGSIREGESIANPLRRSKRFPPLVTHMIAVGEKSGQLEQMLGSVADAYQGQVEVRIQAAVSLFEPILLVIMGGAIGFIAFAILMPLMEMSSGFLESTALFLGSTERTLPLPKRRIS